MEGINILVAEGSPLFKKMFSKAVTQVFAGAHADFAADCEELLAFAYRINFDVVVVDSTLARPSLREFVLKLRECLPSALILVTAQPAKNCDDILSEARGLGAAACMKKPIYSGYEENFHAVREKLEEIARLMDERKAGGKNPQSASRREAPEARGRSSFSPELVIIAASTGGPAALGRVLPELKAEFPVPILVVQHMFPHFTGNLATDLNSKSRLRVKVAEDGEAVAAGSVYIAPGGVHMRLDAEKKISLENSPHVRGVKPAADVLFNSVAEIPGLSGVVAVILTGMGHDGENGLAHLKSKQKCVCLAQSEKTCVIYGMPRAVVERGLADIVLDPDEIPRRLGSFRYPVR